MIFWHWRGPPYVAETFALLSFWVFLYRIVKISIKENKKNLTLCQNNEKWKKFYEFWVNIIADMLSNMSLQNYIEYSSKISLESVGFLIRQFNPRPIKSLLCWICLRFFLSYEFIFLMLIIILQLRSTIHEMYLNDSNFVDCVT